MKKLTAITLTLVLVISIVGSVSAADVKFKLAHNQPKGQGYSEGIVLLKKLVEEGTDGKVKIEEYADGVLGQERDTAEGLKLGTIEMAVISVGVMANYAPTVGILNLPYFFDNASQIDELLNSEVADKMKEEMLDNHGIRILGIYSQGFRNLYGNKKIKNMKDLEGVKIRVPEAPTFVDTFKHLGASPTPIPWGEVYTALQTGVISTYENTPQNTIIFNLFEVIDYATATGHLWGGGVLIISERQFQKLTDEQQEVLIKAGERSAQYHRLRTEAINANFTKQIRNKGIEMFTIDKEPLKKAVEPMYEQYGEKYGISETIQQAIEVIQ